MPKNEIDEQTMFLNDCLNNALANGGKVDNKALGEAYGISAGAVNMRLSRLRKAIDDAKSKNGGEGSSSKDKDDTPKSSPAKAKFTVKILDKGKKRKLAAVNDEHAGDDDDDDEGEGKMDQIKEESNEPKAKKFKKATVEDAV